MCVFFWGCPITGAANIRLLESEQVWAVFTDPRFASIAGTTQYHVRVRLPFQRFASHLIGHTVVYLKIVCRATKLALVAGSFNHRFPLSFWQLQASRFSYFDSKSQCVGGHALPRGIFHH